MDEQLQLLMGQLMSAQQSQTNPLPERTVAEIMVKLYHQGFKFYSTTDGNQYLTPERLDQEILQLVKERGHINIGILPQILNIGQDVIQARVIKILTKIEQQERLSKQQSSGHQQKQQHLILQSQSQRIFKHNNILLSDKYIKMIIENIKQLLLIEGRVNLQAIAQENDFNMIYTEKLIKENITELNAQLINTQLITKQYNHMKKVRLRGFLRAIGSPMSFDSIVKESGLGLLSAAGNQNDNKNIQNLLIQLIEEKQIKGKYQNSYYVPNSFLSNQKQSILEFFNNNGYIEFEMLQKQFLVAKPQEWLAKNIDTSVKYELLSEVCFKAEKLDQYAQQIKEMLKTEGFLEIGSIIPFEFQQSGIDHLLKQYCELKDYFLCDGYVYSAEWLERVLNQFKDKVFKSIFFTGKVSDNTKNKKKGGKKQPKIKLVEEEELVQKLFNQGLAEYSVAENLAPDLLPILVKKLEDMKKKLQKELSQNKGILNNTFLKYKSCKTIMRNEEGLQRVFNIIEKQKKKNNTPWIDTDFGPSQADQKGLFSIIYYDEVLPKGWPILSQDLKWQPYQFKPNLQMQSGLTSSSSMFGQLLACIVDYNRSQSKIQIPNPLELPKTVQSINSLLQQNEPTGPFAFGFFRQKNDRRYVIVDDLMPTLNNGKLIGLSGKYGMVEKAYAKFRYCYKGILNLSAKTLIFQLTGIQPQQYIFQSSGKNTEQMLKIIEQAFNNKRMIILIGQGQINKRIKFPQNQNGDISNFTNLKPYFVHKINEMDEGQEPRQCFTLKNPLCQEINSNSGQNVPKNFVAKMFKNIYIL